MNAPPLTRRKMMPPTPLQNSQEDFEVEDQIWSARDRTVIARTKQYLEENESLKVKVEELESLLGPDDLDVDFRRILNEAKNKKGRTIFETCSSDGPSEFLVVSRARLDEHQRMVHRGSKSERKNGRLSGKKC